MKGHFIIQLLDICTSFTLPLKSMLQLSKWTSALKFYDINPALVNLQNDKGEILLNSKPPEDSTEGWEVKLFITGKKTPQSSPSSPPQKTPNPPSSQTQNSVIAQLGETHRNSELAWIKQGQRHVALYFHWVGINLPFQLQKFWM